MNATWIVMATAPLFFAPATNDGSAAQPGRKLVRVAPHANADEADETFDREGWRKKLTQSDLDGRERAYERLIELARRNDGARRALESWANDSSEPDLAWTARLALRSLAVPTMEHFSGAPQWNDLHSRLDQLRQKFDTFDPMFDNMQRDLDRLFQQQPFSHVQPGQPGGSSQAESFSLHVGPDGVTCEVTEDVDGDKKTRTYKAESLEELLQAHPELRDRIGADGGHAWSWSAPRGLQPLAPRTPDRFRRSLGTQPPTHILGIEYTKPDAEKLKELGLEPGMGLLVENTTRGTIAEILGIQRGDIVIEINETPLHEAADVSRVLKQREADGELAVTIIDKKGQRRTLTWKPSTE